MDRYRPTVLIRSILPRIDPRRLLAVGAIAACAAFLLPLQVAAQFVPPPDPAPTFAPHLGGQWGPVIEWPHVAVTMANLPDGRILTYASNEPNDWPGSATDEYTHAAVWDPSTGTFRSVPHPSHDMFCAAIVTLEDGEVFVMGGRNIANSPWVSYYDFNADRWVQFDTADDMNMGRWYPTAVHLGSGEVFIAAGIGGGVHPEVWRDGLGWTLLSGIDLSSTMLEYPTRDGAGTWPLLTLAPDGTIFHHGATERMNSIDPFGGPGGLGTISDLGPHGFGWFPDEGVSVSYDESRLLVAGGSTNLGNSRSSASAYTIDINQGGPGPILTPTTDMNYPRQFMNEVLLPNGDVLVIGGNTSGVRFQDLYAIRNAESWNPTTGSWTLLNPQDQARTYHSTALLLLDGTVISAGGGLNGEPCPGTGAPGECGVDHWNAEIFSPPYLFESDGSLADRPVLQTAPRVTRVGSTITVHATPGLTGFSLIRMSATTHTMNTDQRFLRPTKVESAPGIYELTLHTNEHVLVPGYWMLFALAGDVPSVGHPLQIVNDGTPRGPPIEALLNDVGDSVLFAVDLEDPDGGAIDFFATNLPPGLSISQAAGVISGTTTTPGLFNVQILALDASDPIDIEFPWIVTAERSESGTLNPTPDVWNTVALSHYYDQPVVVTGPPTFADAEPVTVRVRNVTSTSFEVRVEEWPYLSDGTHAAESLAYLVVEAGEYLLPGGDALVAGVAPSIDYLNPWVQSFSEAAFTTAPGVFAQVATTSAGPNSPPSTVRIDSVSTSGFELRIQEQEYDNQNIPSEDVHWIAIAPTALPGLLETSLSPSPVDETGSIVAFSQGFSSSPQIFASLQSSADLDPVTLRQQNATTAGFDVFVQEESSKDPELDHSPEDFAWLAIDPAAVTLGLLPLFNQPPSIAKPVDQLSRREDSVSLVVEAVDPEGGLLTFSTTGLPSGLAINPSTGEISGTTTTVGDFVVTVTVTDPSGDDDMGVFLWHVDERLELVRFATPPQVDGSTVDYTALTLTVGTYDFEWSFGDGLPNEGPDASPSVQHTFPGPGRYVVTLSVSDPATSQFDSLQYVQIITATPAANAPTSTSTIAYEAANDRVWVVNPDQDTVAVIDAVSNTRVAEIPVSAGPRTLAIAGDGRIWVSCKEASRVDIIDPTSLSVVANLDLQAGSSPHGVVFDPTGTTAFVALEDSGEILRLDGATGAVLASAVVGQNVRHLGVSADGATLYATRFVTPPMPGESIGVPLTESGGDPVGGELLSLDAATFLPGLTTILEVSATPDSATGARGVPNYLGAPAISPDGSELIVPSKQDNVFRGGYRDEQTLVHDRTVRAITSRVDLATGLEDASARVDHDDSSMASAAIYARTGAYAFVTLEGSREVSVVDPFSSLELGRVTAGRAPHGMALSTDGKALYVDNFMDRSVSVFDLSSLLDFDDPALIPTHIISKAQTEALAPDVLLGKQFFYDAADDRLALENYLYCAACHSEGGQDGRVWDFDDLGEGLRNTLDLRGHGVGQGRLHATANFDEFHDFEGQIRRFGGQGLLSNSDFAATEDPLGAPKAGLSSDLDALAAYLASLVETGTSHARQADGSLSPDALAGRDLFASQGCGACHVGDQFSDSDQGVVHDVGTLAAGSVPHPDLDTPTLRGLWRTAPYLHDGSAATLQDAVAAHAFVSLAPNELDSLASYLEQIDDAELTAPNSLPTLDVSAPNDGVTSIEGLAILFTATASDAEDGDLGALVEWSSDLDGNFGTGESLEVSDLSIGVHSISASVTDSLGATTLDQIVLSIAVNQSPSISIISPPLQTMISERTPVTLSGSAIDPEEGDISSGILWSSNLDGALGMGASVVVPELSIGSHVLFGLSVDSLGALDSSISLVTIVANVAPSIVIEAPLGLPEIVLGEAIDLIATATDPEDGDLTNEMLWTSDLDGPLGSGGHLVLDTLTEGLHALTAEATDRHGETRAAQVTVSVVPEPVLLHGIIAGAMLLVGARRRSRSPATAGTATRIREP